VSRVIALALGLGTLAVAWLGLIPAFVPGPFSAHMALHMAVVAIAAPLLALGLATSRLDPVRRVPALMSAVPASIVELVVVWGWHTPALHHAARHSALAFTLEQGSFLSSALWLWCSALGGAPAERGERRGAGILALLLTSMHMTLLGALLALPPRVLYVHGPEHGAHGAHDRDAAEAAGRLRPLDDQHLGGAIMIVLGGAAYMAGGLWLATGLVRERIGAPLRTPPARGSRAVSRPTERAP
jgi:putative membrane protein